MPKVSIHWASHKTTQPFINQASHRSFDKASNKAYCSQYAINRFQQLVINLRAPSEITSPLPPLEDLGLSICMDSHPVRHQLASLSKLTQQFKKPSQLSYQSINRQQESYELGDRSNQLRSPWYNVFLITQKCEQVVSVSTDQDTFSTGVSNLGKMYHHFS